MRSAALLIMLATGRLLAQGSPYVPLQTWGMPYVEYLIARGTLIDPTPLTRPLSQASLARALATVDTTQLNATERRLVGKLLADLTPRESGTSLRIDGHIGAAVATYERRDPLREQGGGGRHAVASGGLGLTLDFGPVVAVTHPYFDNRLKYDPDWYGIKRRVIAGRVAEAYLLAQGKLGEIFFGSLDRNWGPSAVQGLLLSDNPYGFDHLGLIVGTGRVQLQAVVTQLNTVTDSTLAPVNRYMVQHRLWMQPSHRWTLALWEGSVSSGTGRQLEPWYLNIMSLGLLQQLNTGTNVNSFIGVDWERRARLTFFGQAMLDDIQVDRKTAADRKPASYGVTIGASGRFGPGRGTWTAFYTQVANLTYRNEDNAQVPLYFGLGTGRNYDDYDQATLRLGFLPRVGLLLQPELTLLRQGEGDPRLPHPTVAQYGATATIFQGVVTRTLRAALSGSYEPGPRLGVTFDAGVHLVRNAEHVTGVNETRFVGSVSVTWKFRQESVLP